MIVLIVCLFFIVLVWNLAGIYIRYLAAWIGLFIQLAKLAWRLAAMAYSWLRRQRGGHPLPHPAKPLAGDPGGQPMGSTDVRPLKDDRPIKSRISDYNRK